MTPKRWLPARVLWPSQLGPQPGKTTIGQSASWITQLAIFLLASAGFTTNATAQRIEAEWELGPTGSKASLRGLSAAESGALWACGSGATVLRSLDGGSSWEDCSPQAYADLEFRSIHAWDVEAACIASAGTPAVILRTDDAGKTWRETYRFDGSQAFFDGLKFWDDRRGVAFSDPVNGHLLIVETDDGGLTWSAINEGDLPPTLPGEAGFAASNSSLCIDTNGATWIGTGGTERSSSRIHYRQRWNSPWRVSECPIVSAASRGVFSIAKSDRILVAVGGDYRADAESGLTASWSKDGGSTWAAATKPPPSFRSAVIPIPGRKGFIATGPSGTDFSLDASSWESLSPQGFHALAATQTTIFGVGSDGKFGKLVVRVPEREIRYEQIRSYLRQTVGP